jgi:integrase/recombinase XerD
MFAGWLLVNKGLKRSTIGLYCKMIIKVLSNIETVVPSSRQLQDHIIRMHMDRYSSNYIRNVIMAMELYMEHLGCPVKFGRPKKDDRVVKDTLSEAEISIIISACKNVRERAVICLLAYSGARNQEICNVKLSDIDFGNNFIRILDGKGGKSRIVNISGECVKILLEYLARYPRGGSDYLFTTIRKNEQYTTWSLRRMIKGITSRTPIRKKVYPHLFRHSLACNMLFRGANLLTIKEQLGHSFIETTMIYVKSRADRVSAEYRMFTPSYI